MIIWITPQLTLVMIGFLEYVFDVIEKFSPKETCNFCVGTSNKPHDATGKPQCAKLIISSVIQPRDVKSEVKSTDYKMDQRLKEKDRT